MSKLFHSSNLKECLSNFIVKQHQNISRIFIILVIVSIFASLFVKTNYELTKYLPSWTETKKGVDLMTDEFGYPGTAQVMIDNISLFEAKTYADEFKKVNGVDSVTWAGSVGQIDVADNFLEIQDGINDYYQDKHALFDITFEKDNSDPLTYQAVDNIKEIAGSNAHYAGSAIDDKSLGDSIAQEVPKIMVFAVVLIIIILTLTTNSWFEPIIFLLTMGVAIILNMGSNIFFGEISFLSASIASVLQLATAMDYSIFLLHNFSAQKNNHPETDPAKIMTSVLQNVLSSILSSAITTMIGFSALALMQFTIGRDLGFVLAKSIFCSLLTVVFLTPALILKWNHLIEKYHHQPFLPSFTKFSKNILKLRYFVIVLVLLTAIPSFFAQNMNSFVYGTSSISSSQGTKTYQDSQAIEKVFGQSNFIFILYPNQNNVKEKILSDELRQLSFVKSVTSLSSNLPQGIPESIIPNNILNQLHSQNYARLIIDTNLATESDYSFKSLEQIKTITQKYYPQNTYFLGSIPATLDIKNTISSDYTRVNLLSILGVFITTIITFHSVVLALCVMITIEIAIFLNMALPYLYGQNLAFLGYVMVSSMQLGATVDYAILLTNNYLFQKNKHHQDSLKSAQTAVKNSFTSILTSALILTSAGYGIYFIISIATISDLGRLIGRGAVSSLFFVTFLLPVLLITTNKFYLKEQKLFSHFFKK